jgi:hypothetical protein
MSRINLDPTKPRPYPVGIHIDPIPTRFHKEHRVFGYNHHNGFEAYGHPRSSPAHIHKMLSPEQTPGRKARAHAIKRVSYGMDMNWLRSQKEHYGLGGRDFQNLDDFKAADRAGDFYEVPDWILDIEEELKTHYIAANKQHIESTKEKILADFQAAKSPLEEAACHAGLFLQKYFLDDEGWPDKTRTPGLLLLDAVYLKKKCKLHGLEYEVGRIDGLSYLEIRSLDWVRTVCISWDRDAALELDKKTANRLLRDQAIKLSTSFQQVFEQDPQISSRSTATGTYRIVCDEFYNNFIFRMKGPKLKMYIYDNGFPASTRKAARDELIDAQFDFGHFPGAMRLTRSSQSLLDVCEYDFESGIDADAKSNSCRGDDDSMQDGDSDGIYGSDKDEDLSTRLCVPLGFRKANINSKEDRLGVREQPALLRCRVDFQRFSPESAEGPDCSGDGPQNESSAMNSLSDSKIPEEELDAPGSPVHIQAFLNLNVEDPDPLTYHFIWRNLATTDKRGPLPNQWDGDETANKSRNTIYTNTGYLKFTDSRYLEFAGVGNFGILGQQVRFEGYKTNPDIDLQGHEIRKWEYYNSDHEIDLDFIW